ncbi:MAG: NapC/NirT family cytochrome c [Pseudomonadota bacterium]
MTDTNKKKGFIARLRSPHVKWSLGGILFVGFVAGIIFWGGFNTAMEMSNTEEFCISCHEMHDNVFQEYKDTIHYSNASGVRATCPDCHVPKEWNHKVVRKIRATNELYHKALGSINTAEKFEAKRLELAQNVWRAMKATDSRECRNCHDFDSMDYTRQGRRAVRAHEEGLTTGETCIDCHKGIAHSLPDMHEVDPSAVLGAVE